MENKSFLLFCGKILWQKPMIFHVAVDDIFLAKTRIQLFLVYSQIFWGVFFCWSRSEKVVWWWKSIRKCQISDHRATRIANFLCPFPTMVGDRLRGFPHDNFLVFYKNHSVIFDVANICIEPLWLKENQENWENLKTSSMFLHFKSISKKSIFFVIFIIYA